MYCPNCGIELENDLNFCSSCGTNMNETVAEIDDRNKQNKNPMLNTLLACGIVAMLLGILLPLFNITLWIIVIASSIIVYKDARTNGVGNSYKKEKLTKMMTWKPLSWGVMVFFLWIIILPLYIIKWDKLITKF